jgi:hypothetical protein
MEAPKRPKPSRRKIGHIRSKVKANATKTSKLTVAERVNKRKQLSKVQHEIEGIMRELEHANGLTEIVKLRKQLSLKDEERDKLYKETMNMNAPMNKPKTLKERRTKKKPEIRPRINATTLKLKDRKALNLERMYQLKKEAEKKVESPQEDLDLDGPDFDLADLVGVQDKIPRINATLKLKDRNALNLERMYQMQKNEEFAQEGETARLKEMQPRVKHDVSEKAYYAMKEDGDVPKELKSMVLKPLKKRPKPKRSNVSL